MQPKETITELMAFLTRIKDDPRIGHTHICLYLAILKCWIENEGKQPISVFSKNLMGVAKISGISTYHKTVKELHEYGYIRYAPSFNPLLGSLIYLDRKTKGD